MALAEFVRKAEADAGVNALRESVRVRKEGLMALAALLTRRNQVLAMLVGEQRRLCTAAFAFHPLN